MRLKLRRLLSWWRSQHILRRVIVGYVVLIALPAVLIGIVVNSWMTATVLGRASQAMTDRVEQWRSAVTTASAPSHAGRRRPCR
ncbi:MAG: hypothetical protein ACOC2N_05415, partial [Spirochaetota bacterium]